MIFSLPLPQRAIEVFSKFPTLPPLEGLRLGVENALSDTVVATRPELVEEVLAYRLQYPPPLDGWQAQAAANLGWDVRGQLDELRMPVLVITGTADNVVDPAGLDLIAGLVPHARLERLE